MYIHYGYETVLGENKSKDIIDIIDYKCVWTDTEFVCYNNSFEITKCLY